MMRYLTVLRAYSIEIVYLVLITLAYIFISPIYSVNIKNTSPELIRLINRISDIQRDNPYWVVTETTTKTVREILKTQNVLSIESVANINNPQNIQNAFLILKDKFKTPIYLIINNQNHSLTDRFMSARIDFPFQKIYEFVDSSSSYALYLFKPRD